MSYVKTPWVNVPDPDYATDEPKLDADNLNKMEQGIYDAHEIADGKYTKPVGGIPENDLANSVKASLEKADSALQIYNIVYTVEEG